MARPRIPKRLRKTRQVLIRVTEEEKVAVRRKAKKLNMSESDYGRKHIPELG